MAMHQIRELTTDELAELCVGTQARLGEYMALRQEMNNAKIPATEQKFVTEKVAMLSNLMTALHLTQIHQ